MTFSEFANCIILKANKEGVEALDEHWKPQHLFCDVCNIKYKHIGHMETLGKQLSLHF